MARNVPCKIHISDFSYSPHLAGNVISSLTLTHRGICVDLLYKCVLLPWFRAVRRDIDVSFVPTGYIQPAASWVCFARSGWTNQQPIVCECTVARSWCHVMGSNEILRKRAAIRIVRGLSLCLNFAWLSSDSLLPNVINNNHSIAFDLDL